MPLLPGLALLPGLGCSATELSPLPPPGLGAAAAERGRRGVARARLARGGATGAGAGSNGSSSAGAAGMLVHPSQSAGRVASRGMRAAPVGTSLLASTLQGRQGLGLPG